MDNVNFKVEQFKQKDKNGFYNRPIFLSSFTVLYVLRHKDSSAPVRSDHEALWPPQIGTEVYRSVRTLRRQFLDAELSWCRSVRSPPEH